MCTHWPLNPFRFRWIVLVNNLQLNVFKCVHVYNVHRSCIKILETISVAIFETQTLSFFLLFFFRSDFCFALTFVYSLIYKIALQQLQQLNSIEKLQISYFVSIVHSVCIWFSKITFWNLCCVWNQQQKKTVLQIDDAIQTSYVRTYMQVVLREPRAEIVPFIWYSFADCYERPSNAKRMNLFWFDA